MAEGVYPFSSQNLTAFDTGAVTEAMKIHYKPLRVKEMVYKHNPLLALMPKYEAFGGLNMPIPILYSNPQRSGATFQSAQIVDAGTKLKQFEITRKKAYSFASVDGQTIKASAGNSDAFLRYLTMEIDGAIHTIKRRLAVHMYGDGSGVIGTTASQVGTVVTLADKSQISNFEVGMWLQGFKPGDGATHTAAAAGNKPEKIVEVTAVDRTNGTLTLDVAFGDHANGALLMAYGDVGLAPSPANLIGAESGLAIRGLAAWIPSDRATTGANKPLVETFNKVVRTTDPTRLGGQYFSGSSMPIEEALVSAAALTAREGGAPGHCFVDYDTWSSLEKALGSRVQYTQAKARDVDVGFQAISIQGPMGPIAIIPDMNCQSKTAWMLQMDTWSLNSLGACPQILDQDGQRMLRETTEDAYEVRVGYYADMACNAPGFNCRVSL